MNPILYKLSNEIIQDRSISNEAFYVYLGIRVAYGNTKKNISYSSDYIYHMLTGGLNPSRYFKEIIGQGFRKLDVNVVYDGQHSKIINAEKLIPPDGKGKFFTLIDDDEIKKILNYSRSKSDIKLLRVFCVLLSTMYQEKLHKKYIGNFTLEQQLKLINISKNTYLKYLDILENGLELIHIYRPNTLLVKYDGSVSGAINNYGRKRDCTFIDQMGCQYLEKIKGENITKKISNKANPRRWAAQIYLNWMGGKEYPEEDLEKAYHILLEMNNVYSKEISKTGRIRDLTSFENYSFYEGDKDGNK